MNKLLKLCWIFLFFILYRNCYTQSVSHTGQIPINVPIHTIQDGSISIPISLVYDHSGIKPDVHPGWVGQNWSLMSGGKITRVVRDIPDDFSGYVYLPGPQKEPMYSEYESPVAFYPLKRKMQGLTQRDKIAASVIPPPRFLACMKENYGDNNSYSRFVY